MAFSLSSSQLIKLKRSVTSLVLRKVTTIVCLFLRKAPTKKLASNPLLFQPPKKPEEARKPANRCRRCGKFSQEDLCETHKQLIAEKLEQDEASKSKSFPKMPNCETEERTVIIITTNSQTTGGEGDSIVAGENTEANEVTEFPAAPPTTTSGRTLTAETPMPSSPIGCSTEISTRTNGRDLTATPTRPSDTITESPAGGKVCGSEWGRVESVGENIDKDLEKLPGENQNIRRSSRIRTAKRVEKMGA